VVAIVTIVSGLKDAGLVRVGIVLQTLTDVLTLALQGELLFRWASVIEVWTARPHRGYPDRR
jgi:hypothetical protein